MNENILGYNVSTLSLDECVQQIVTHLKNCNSTASLSCLNPHAYAVAKNDVFFSKALKASNWLVPDGIGVVFASILSGGKIRQRITGYDIFAELLRRIDQDGSLSVFFLGSSEDTLAKVREKLIIDYPNIHIAGTCSPPFKEAFSESELTEMIDRVNASKADILWVGMTAPKQEKWILQNQDRLKVGFVAAIGAVFDFYSGQVKRSPKVFRSIGLEWLPRLLMEPRRLWKRTILSAPIFLRDLLFSQKD